MGRVAADVGALPDVTEKTMHDAYELSKFFSKADLADKTEVLLEICNREPDLLLSVIRDGQEADNMDNQLRALMAAGEKIPAIKLHRRMTGVGLKESKDYVEAL